MNTLSELTEVLYLTRLTVSSDSKFQHVRANASFERKHWISLHTRSYAPLIASRLPLSFCGVLKESVYYPF